MRDEKVIVNPELYEEFVNGSTLMENEKLRRLMNTPSPWPEQTEPDLGLVEMLQRQYAEQQAEIERLAATEHEE